MKKNKIIGASVIYAISSVMIQLVGFLMLPIYTRYLTPEDYGVIGILVATFSLSQLFFAMSFTTGLPRFYFNAKDEEERCLVFSTPIISTVMSSIVAVLLIIYFNDGLSKVLFGDVSKGKILAIYSLSILINTLHDYGIDFLRIRNRPYLYLLISVIQLSLQVALNLYFIVYQELGVEGFVYGSVTSLAVIMVILIYIVIKHTGIGFKKSIFIDMLRFHWPIWLSGLGGMYLGSSGLYYLRWLSSLTDAGLYTLAMKFSMILSILVWIPFMMQWEVTSFESYNANNHRPLFSDTFFSIILLMSLGALGIGLFSEYVIFLMASEQFHDAYIAIPFLVYAVCFSSMADFFNFSYMASGHTKKISVLMFYTAVVLTALYIMLVPVYGFVGIALSTLFAQIFRFVFTYMGSLRYIDLKVKIGSPLFFLLSTSLVCVALTKYMDVNNIIYEFYIRAAFYLVFVIYASILLVRRFGLKKILESVRAG